MIVSNMPTLHYEVFPIAYLLELSLQFVFNILVGKYLATILWCPDQMVLAIICTMIKIVVQMVVFSHKNHLLSSVYGGDFIIYGDWISLEECYAFKRTHPLTRVVSILEKEWLDGIPSSHLL